MDTIKPKKETETAERVTPELQPMQFAFSPDGELRKDEDLGFGSIEDFRKRRAERAAK